MSSPGPWSGGESDGIEDPFYGGIADYAYAGYPIITRPTYHYPQFPDVSLAVPWIEPMLMDVRGMQHILGPCAYMSQHAPAGFTNHTGRRILVLIYDVNILTRDTIGRGRHPGPDWALILGPGIAHVFPPASRAISERVRSVVARPVEFEYFGGHGLSDYLGEEATWPNGTDHRT